MAKKVVKRKSTSNNSDGATYFYLVIKTEKGRKQKESVLRREQNQITKMVNAEGGKCELHSTQGPHDFVSRVTGVSATAAIRIAQAIEAGGNVNTIMLPAVPVRK
jgi:uncharacterized protein with GYD domain